MTTYSTAFPATVILSLLSSIVQGQDYSNRGERLLHTPDHFQCDSDGFHADSNDCSIFYRCIDWGESSENSLQPRYTSFKFQCGEGTVFDIESNNCVHIEETTRSECRHYAEPYAFARISQRDSGDPEQTDYGVVQQPSSGYNRPSQQPSYNRPSTDGQMPGDSGDVDNTIGEPSSPPSKSPDCEADGFFPIPNDCEHFYRCVGNGNGFSKYEFSCGPGTVWDPDSNACNHRWAVSRSDCRSEGGSESGGSEGGPETGEGLEGGPESPEIEQVAEPSSSTAVSSTSTTTRPYQPSSSTSRPSSSTTSKPTTTTSKSTTTTKRSTTLSSPKPTTISSTTSSSTTEASPSSTTPSEGTTGNGTKPNEGSNGNGTKPENSCDSEGFFADEKDCKKFYRCVDQGGKFTKYEFECAEGTVWDIQETTCNYEYAVQRSNCNSSGSESQTSSTSDQSSSATDQSSSATSSTSASSSSQTTSSASSGTSSTSSYTNSTSSSTSQQSSTSQTTSSSSQTTSSQASNSSSTTSSQSTSTSQQTTSSQQSTTAANSTSSQNGTTSVVTESGTSASGSQSKDDRCTEEGFFPSSKNCNKFYRCVRNEGSGFMKYEFNCGPGTVWDPENNVCNHPWAVTDEKCRSGGQGTTPIGESETSESTPLSSSTEGSSSSAEGSSSSTEGSSSSTDSSSSSTEGSSPPLESNTTSTALPSTTASQTSTTNANTTTTASTNNTDSTESATTTSSNSTATTIESSSISTTIESNVTTTESGCTNSTTNKPPSKIKCEKAGYYPNPDDCKKFYRCVDWDGDKGERFSVYHFNCPEGTIFDPSLNICNHAESVYPPRNCDGSSGSQTTDSTPTSSPGSDNTTTTEPTTDSSTSNTTDVTETSSEPTTLQPTTDSTNTTEQTTPGSETTPQTTPALTTPSEQTTMATSTSEKGTEATTSATSGAGSTEPTTPYTTPSSQITTTQITTTEISTTTSPSSESCPDIGPDQFRLVCPTGFRRHPKYCNLFYQCTVSKSMDIKIVTLSCTNGTVYDEKKIQCLPPEEAKKCEGSMMTDARNLKNLGDNSISPIPVKSDKSICPNEGSFTYKDDCRLFYKCKKDDQGKLTGYLYQCPEGFAYWSVSKRCEKTEKVPCENKKTSSTTWKSTIAPVESKNVGF